MAPFAASSADDYSGQDFPFKPLEMHDAERTQSPRPRAWKENAGWKPAGPCGPASQPLSPAGLRTALRSPDTPVYSLLLLP